MKTLDDPMSKPFIEDVENTSDVVGNNVNPNPFSRDVRVRRSTENTGNVTVQEAKPEMRVIRFAPMVFVNREMHAMHPHFIAIREAIESGFKPFGVLNADAGHALLFLFKQ